MAPHNRLARIVALALVAAIGGGTIAGCSSENASVSCTLDACTVTLNRGVDAKTSVLGVEVKLVSVTDDQVILDVNGNQVAVPNGGTETESGGLNIKVQKVTSDQVVLQVSQA